MNLNNDFLAVLDADVNRHMATANGTPPPPSPTPPPPPPSAPSPPAPIGATGTTPPPATQAAERFPLDILPPRAVAYIEALEYANGVPRDFMAAAMLWAAATATGNAVHIEIKAGTRYSAILFLGLIGLPNSNKSAALRAALAPLYDVGTKALEKYKIELREYEAAQGMSKAERQAAGLVDAKKPVFSKIILSDTTPEYLGDAHKSRPRGIAVVRDEMAAWFKTFDRYSNGAEAEMWLSLWIAAVLSVDRRSSEPTYIENPFINVAGTLQPSILERLAADDRGQNGFLDRLLFCWPDGLTKPVWDDRGLDLTLRDAYADAIGRLLQLPFDAGAPRIITLKAEAWQALKAWKNGHNKPLCDNAENELLQGLHGKMDIHADRLILVLHLLRHAYGAGDLPTEIDAATVADGIRAAEYFRAQSLKVHQRIFGADPVERLPSDRRKLYDALPKDTPFKTAEAVEIGKKHGIKDRTLKTWLKDRTLFERIAHGVYTRCL